MPGRKSSNCYTPSPGTRCARWSIGRVKEFTERSPRWTFCSGSSLASSWASSPSSSGRAGTRAASSSPLFSESSAPCWEVGWGGRWAFTARVKRSGSSWRSSARSSSSQSTAWFSPVVASSGASRRGPRRPPPTLQLVADRDGQELEETGDDAATAPAPVLDLSRRAQVLLERRLESTRHRPAVDHQVQLVVQREGPIVQIRAAHRRPHPVDDHRLGVQQRRAVLVNVHARLEHAPELAAARLAHQAAVDHAGG